MNSSLEPGGKVVQNPRRHFVWGLVGKEALVVTDQSRRHEQRLLDEDLRHLVIAPSWWPSSWSGSLTPSSSRWCCPSPTTARSPPDLCYPDNWGFFIFLSVIYFIPKIIQRLLNYILSQIDFFISENHGAITKLYCEPNLFANCKKCVKTPNIIVWLKLKPQMTKSTALWANLQKASHCAQICLGGGTRAFLGVENVPMTNNFNQ